METATVATATVVVCRTEDSTAHLEEVATAKAATVAVVAVVMAVAVEATIMAMAAAVVAAAASVPGTLWRARVAFRLERPGAAPRAAGAVPLEPGCHGPRLPLWRAVERLVHVFLTRPFVLVDGDQLSDLERHLGEVRYVGLPDGLGCRLLGARGLGSVRYCELVWRQLAVRSLEEGGAPGGG
mgnify:CR=1 FL=1